MHMPVVCCVDDVNADRLCKSASASCVCVCVCMYVCMFRLSAVWMMSVLTGSVRAPLPAVCMCVCMCMYVCMYAVEVKLL
jgi:hypothetical protein